MRYISRSNLSSISIIFTVGLLPLLFQTDTNLFNNNFNISLNNVIQFAYAQQEYEDENNEDGIDSTIDDKSSYTVVVVVTVINNNKKSTRLEQMIPLVKPKSKRC